MLFLPLADIGWLEAAGQSVALHVGTQTHLLRRPIASVVAKLPPGRFLSLGPSSLVNVGHIRELQHLRHGRCRVLLRDGTHLTFLTLPQP